MDTMKLWGILFMISSLAAAGVGWTLGRDTSLLAVLFLPSWMLLIGLTLFYHARVALLLAGFFRMYQVYSNAFR
jgi:hypothetical protein